MCGEIFSVNEDSSTCEKWQRNNSQRNKSENKIIINTIQMN